MTSSAGAEAPSLTDAILELVNPDALPEPVREMLELVGPHLAAGRTFAQIAEQVGLSEDGVSTRVRAIRQALVEQALAHADELDCRLRARLEELRG